MTINELQAENAVLQAKVAELEAQLAKISAASKGRAQAEAALELLKAGPVTIEQLKAINGKYPSDPIFGVRTLLKVAVKTNRSKNGGTTYQLEQPVAEASVEQPEVVVESEQPSELEAEPVEVEQPAELTEEVTQ